MQFYSALRETLVTNPKEEKMILLGDFNARVGKHHLVWDAIRRYGIDKVSSNGLSLLQLCSEFNLVICNTYFRQKQNHKVT